MSVHWPFSSPLSFISNPVMGVFLDRPEGPELEDKQVEKKSKAAQTMRGFL
jgi:hypothetical protein